MAKFSAEEILEITTARLAAGLMPEDKGSLSTDTRTLSEGQWYVAMHGKSFDGHDFIGDAFSAGALGCIVEERASYPIAATSFPLLAVTDTLEALCKLAQSWRLSSGSKAKICLMPSSGSSSELLLTIFSQHSQALSQAFSQVQAQPATRSSVILHHADCRQIAEALLKIDAQTDAVIIEYFPATLENVNLVCAMTAPNVVLVFDAAFSHLRLQSSHEQLAEAKAVINNCLKRPGDMRVPQTLIEQFETEADGASAFEANSQSLCRSQPVVPLVLKHLGLETLT